MQDERPSGSSSFDAGSPAEYTDTEAADSPIAPSFTNGTELNNRNGSNNVKRKLPFVKSASPSSSITLSPHLTHLVDSYSQSDIAQGIRQARAHAQESSADVDGNLDRLAGLKRASWWTQFTILSGRAFKNLYRNPMLMLSHYAISILIARE